MAKEPEETSVSKLDHRRRADIVVKRFVEGMSIPNIVQYLQDHFGMEVGRDVPYQDIARATNKRWLQYVPPAQIEIAERLIKMRQELLDVFIPSAGEGMTTANAAANLCGSAIFEIAKAKAIGTAVGDPAKDIEPWKFEVRVKNAAGKVMETTPFARVDHGEVEDQNLEPLPMKITVRIGFSGGNTMALTCRDLSHVIAQRVEDWEAELKRQVIDSMRQAGHESLLPNRIVKRRFKVDLRFLVMNLNAGFDSDPRTNPIAFLSALLSNQTLASRTKVEIFNAMPFVEIGECRPTIKKITSLREVRNDYNENHLDIILTSGGDLDDPHSTYRRYYKDPRVHELLAREGVIGDVMWLPITNDGPFDLGALKDKVKDDPEFAKLIRYRPMTLLTLQDVVEHVRAKRDVFCVLAPCGVCGVEKSRVARALLNQKKGQGLVTHLVLDRGTADATVEALG